MSDDFPTLERPMKAYSGLSGVGMSFTITLLFTKVASSFMLAKVGFRAGPNKGGLLLSIFAQDYGNRTSGEAVSRKGWRQERASSFNVR